VRLGIVLLALVGLSAPEYAHAQSAADTITLSVANVRSVPLIDASGRGRNDVTAAVRGCLRRASLGHLWLRYDVRADGSLADITIEHSTLAAGERRCIMRALPSVRYPHDEPATVRLALRTGSHRNIVRDSEERQDQVVRIVVQSRSAALRSGIEARRAQVGRCLEELMERHDTYVFEVFEVRVSDGENQVEPLPEPRAAIYNRLRGEVRTDDVVSCLQSGLAAGLPDGVAGS
jgi:hypothetical protein